MKQIGGFVSSMNSYNEKKNTYVKNQLLKTMLKKLKKQSIDSIVISDLIEQAGVSRVSFYRNYASKEDILIQEERRLFSEWSKEHNKGIEDNHKDFNKELLDFYFSNKDFYLTIYNAGLKSIIMDTLLSGAKIADNDPNPLAYFKSSIAYMIYGWIDEWMKRGMVESGTELSKIISDSINK